MGFELCYAAAYCDRISSESWWPLWMLVNCETCNSWLMLSTRTVVWDYTTFNRISWNNRPRTRVDKKHTIIMNDDRANNNRYKLAAYCIKVSTSEIHVCKADDFFFLKHKTTIHYTYTCTCAVYTFILSSVRLLWYGNNYENEVKISVLFCTYMRTR